MVRPAACGAESVRYYALVCVAYCGLIVLTYFSVDRYLWDSDSAHFADFDSASFFNMEMLVAYGVSWFLTITSIVVRFCLCSPAASASSSSSSGKGAKWCRLSGIEAGRRERWGALVEKWSLAISVPLSVVSLTQLCYDRWWSWYGTYSPAAIVCMAVVTTIVLAANTLLLVDARAQQNGRADPYISIEEYPLFTAESASESASESSSCRDGGLCL